MYTEQDLKSVLNRIDGKGYGAYRDTYGAYQFTNYVLSIDHVQGDPFAPPSRLSLTIPGDVAGFPPNLYRLPEQRIALQDALIRIFGKSVCSAVRSGRDGHGMRISRCGQEILERTACQIDPATGTVIFRFDVQFPARGRTIMGRQLQNILCNDLPQSITRSLLYRNMDAQHLQEIANLAEDQTFIRTELLNRNLCAFVADGSVLPRSSGASSLPMQGAVPFTSPPELAVELDLPHRGRVRGMGIPKGVTLIVGGGYHGKSTLLEALELGVYNHIAGDGRELVITDNTAVKIRAEDGRSVKGTDISWFITNLPNGCSTTSFFSDDASGSTSQAANVIEGIEAGANVLLIDEDTSATNFMIRDELMQRVIHKEMEPITPFIARVREIYEKFGVSTILVAGSSGAYFHVADAIIQMERYVAKVITGIAKKEAEAFPLVTQDVPPGNEIAFHRCPQRVRHWDGPKIKSQGLDQVTIGDDVIDMRLVEQIVDGEQMRTLGNCLVYAGYHLMDGSKEVRQIADEVDAAIEQNSLSVLNNGRRSVPDFARPRKQEIVAIINRYRRLNV